MSKILTGKKGKKQKNKQLSLIPLWSIAKDMESIHRNPTLHAFFKMVPVTLLFGLLFIF
tara:strand:- start:11 stop:187 length:177 start_codon:yes stop_codon:yes gene_type:complete